MNELFTRTEHLNGKVTLYGGDNRDVLKSMPDASIDAIVTDPPYAMVSIVKRFGGEGAKPTKDGDVYSRSSAGFMGKQWDTGETAFSEEFWAEVYRVLKPGGHVAAFSGTRTYHRMACAIEDAGFEIRDQLAWAYGSGFPKSHDVSKAIDKMLGAERSKVRVKHSSQSLMTSDGQNERPWQEAAKKNGYHELASNIPATPEARQWQGWGTALKPSWEPIVLARKPLTGTVAANVLKHGTGALNIDGCRVGWPDGKVPAIGTPEWGGPNKKSTAVPGQEGETVERVGPSQLGRWPANIVHDGSDEVLAGFPETSSGASKSTYIQKESENIAMSGKNYERAMKDSPASTGSAARFFYTAKADKLDRIGSKHPTVKPVDLMQWLCRLITPPGGVILDPFAGSGSTGEAAWREGFDCVLIEREAEYQADIAERLKLADKGPMARKARAIKQTADHGPLFGGAANDNNGGGLG